MESDQINTNNSINNDNTDNDNKINDKNDINDEAIDSKKTASFKQLFSEADSYDIFLMTIGTIGALATGASFPFFNVLFGDMMDALNSDPNGFSDSIADISTKFCYVAVANLVSCTLQVTAWSIAGERQTHKLRLKYGIYSYYHIIITIIIIINITSSS